MDNLPFFDLKAQTALIRGEIEQALGEVLAGGNFILGPQVDAFEQEFAAALGLGNVIGVASGTDALQIALLALGVGPGDEVISVAHTAVADVAAIEMTGARPVLVDIDPYCYTLDPRRLENAITGQTRAVIPVHLYGCPADLEPILEIARRRRLWVIEDCAQSHGAKYGGKATGAWGHAAAFSFYPTKNLGAFGDAGAVVTGDADLAQRMRLIRQYGWQERFISQHKGMNSRLDEIQAAVLRIKLRHLETWNGRRREIARLYTHLLAGSCLQLPSQPENAVHVFHQYVVRHPERDRLRAHLKAQGIETGIHYPLPIHLQPAYAHLGCLPGDLPESERAALQVLSLPVYPELSDEDIRRVCDAILQFCAGREQRLTG